MFKLTIKTPGLHQLTSTDIELHQLTSTDIQHIILVLISITLNMYSPARLSLTVKIWF